MIVSQVWQSKCKIENRCEWKNKYRKADSLGARKLVHNMKWEENVRKVVPYVAGEQPNKPNMIKLNTNECPYPPAPGVKKLAEELNCGALRLYPDTNATPLVDALAEYYGVKPEQIFVGVGSDDVLAMAFLTFFNSDNHCYKFR